MGGIQFLSLRSFQPSRQSRESLSHILLLEASLGVEGVDPGLGGHWSLCLAMGGVCQCSLMGQRCLAGSEAWRTYLLTSSVLSGYLDTKSTNKSALLQGTIISLETESTLVKWSTDFSI